MGRPHKNVAVVVAFNAAAQIIDEDIVPRPNVETSGSLLLNSAHVRKARGIRFLTVRVFDELGNRVENYSESFDRDGQRCEQPHRMPDGTILE